jgi:septum formation protein
MPPRSPERPHGLAPAAEHARLSAAAKAAEVAALHAGRLVLGADTVVSVGPGVDDVLGKPGDDEEAASMLRRLSGRVHEVVTGLALVGPGGECSDVALTRVRIRPLSEAFIRRYVATHEPADKAGAYAIQGRIATHVDGIDGSWSNVVGLPQELLAALFARRGLDLADWQDW